jgi:hypothetical protein
LYFAIESAVAFDITDRTWNADAGDGGTNADTDVIITNKVANRHVYVKFFMVKL